MQVRAGGAVGKYYEHHNSVSHAYSIARIMTFATYLLVNLIHWGKVAREVGEVDIALDDRVTGDTGTLEDLGQVLDSSTLRRSRQISRRTIHLKPMNWCQV